jgi:hypothetical protein
MDAGSRIKPANSPFDRLKCGGAKVEDKKGKRHFCRELTI